MHLPDFVAVFIEQLTQAFGVSQQLFFFPASMR